MILTNTHKSYPMLAGNVAALLSPLIFVPLLTYTFGRQNYNYETMHQIRKVDDTEISAAAHVDPELIPNEIGSMEETQSEEEKRKLDRAALYSRTLTVFLALALLILWPIPMYGSSYVFSKKFFTGWVVVGLVWLFCTAFGVVLFPLYEGWGSIIRVVKMMCLDLMGMKPVVHNGRKAAEEMQSSGLVTPTMTIHEKGEMAVPS